MSWFHPPKGEEPHHAYHTPLEKKIKLVLSPFEQFTQSQVTSSIFLLLATVLALLFASIPALNHYYEHIITMRFGFHIGSSIFVRSIKVWVNDILLTLFFFIVGLEIKREFLAGELTQRKRAVLVAAGAIGGVVVPAIIYLLFNFHSDMQWGWGIPTATDTAFALGLLAYFRNKLPKGVFTFMAALSIVDDIVAILIISIFYSNHVNLLYLGVACAFIGFLVFLNYAGFRRPFPYLVVGLAVWAFVELAGVHGTIAGILVALTIPARPQRGPKQFIKKVKKLLVSFEKRKEHIPNVLYDKEQHAILEAVKETAKQATTPLQRWESAMELPITLLVLPSFAFLNAGIPLHYNLVCEALTHSVSLGIFFGLVIGKPLGIILFSKLALRMRIATLPKETTFHHIVGISFLGGIGFTMSLFITALAFEGNPQTLVLAKTGILIGSLVAGVISMIILFILIRRKTESPTRTT